MNRFIKSFLALAVLASSAMTLQAKDYLAADFGAKADGRTLNTASIQAAIDFASANGGGRVVLTPGMYLCGSIWLKNDVTLHLEAGATLLGSLNPWDYVKDDYIRWTAFVFAVKQNNIGITGEGIIDCRGFEVANAMVQYIHRGLFEDKLVLDRPQEANRPQVIHFRECKGVKILDVTLKNPACWTQQYELCEDLLIEREKVDRAKKLQKMSKEERELWLKMHKEELDEEKQDELEEKMLDKDSQEELKKLAEQVKKQKLGAAEKEIKAAAADAAAENERGKLDAEKKAKTE